MIRKQIFTAILLITAGLAVLGAFDGEANAETTYSTLEVGSGKTYSTIQSAINAASEGDLIQVYPGTYYENVIVNRSVMIKGDGPESTIIDAGGSSSAMIVESDNCRIERLAFTGSGGEAMEGFNTGLRLDSDNNVALNCTAYDNYMGILSYWGENNKIIYCEAYENEVHGIGLGRYSKIQGCYSHDNTGSGFWAFVNPGSLVERCRSENNGYMGFQFDHTENTQVKEFIGRNNDAYGIGIDGGSVGNGNSVEKSLLVGNGQGGLMVRSLEGPLSIWNNTISDNYGQGINFSNSVGGSGIDICENRIIDNDWFGIQINSGCQDVQIFRNDIIDNYDVLKQGMDENTGNLWDIQGRGNYWNDWTTPDANSDGIVDNPYVLYGSTSQQDKLPLTTPIFSNPVTLPSNDLWESGKFYVDLDWTTPDPPVGDDDEEPDIVDPPVDDDDTDPPFDDDVQPPDHGEVEGTPDIEFQNEPYVEGSDQDVSVPEDFLRENTDLEYEWYVEGYGFMGKGESIDLDLPAGKYQITLVGRNNEDVEVFSISKEIQIQSTSETGNGVVEVIQSNIYLWIISIVSVILIITLFGFVLGRKRKSMKDHESNEKIPAIMLQQGERRKPDVGQGSFTPTEDVISGKLQPIAPIENVHNNGNDEMPISSSDDLGYEEMITLSEAMETVKEGKEEGSFMERSREMLEKKYQEGDLDESEFMELNEVLERYMK